MVGPSQGAAAVDVQSWAPAGISPVGSVNVVPLTVQVPTLADQNTRLVCMLVAMLAASIEAIARMRALLALESARPCMPAMPSIPTEMTMRATITSTNVKPRVARVGDS